MKKALIFSMLIAIFAITSCGTVSNTVSTNDTAKTMGTTCGTALSGLYKSYKAAGNKININDASTLTNVIAISTSTSTLRTNGKDASFRKSYIAGLVAGSGGLITNDKASKIYDKLLASASAISTVNTSSTASTLTSATNALLTVLALF